MSFLKAVFGTKSANAKPSDAIVRAMGASSASYNVGGYGLGTVGDWDYDRAVRDGLERVTWIFRCVDVIAQKQSTLPIEIRDNYGSEEGRVIDDKQLEKLLNFRANSYETAQQFRYRLSAITLLSRRGAFIEVIRDNAGRPVQMHLLPPGITRPIPDPVNFVSGYELIRGDGEPETVPADRVIWVRVKPHPNDVYAQLTPLTTSGISIETELLARTFNRNFIANDGRPSMLINVEGQADPDSLEEIRERFRYPVPGETSVINSDGVTVADLATSPRDLQWTELLRLSKEEILMAFGVPESVMGNASGRTFDNADAEREMFYVDTMQPHCNAIASSLDKLTQDMEDDVVPAFDYSGVAVLQRIAQRRREEWRKEFDAGLRTIDEYREPSDLKPFGVAGTRSLMLRNNIGISANDTDQQTLPSYPMLGQPPMMDQEQESFDGAMAGAEEGMRQLDNIISARALAIGQKSIRPRGRAPRSNGRRVEAKSLDGGDDDSDRVPGHKALGVLDTFLDCMTEHVCKSLPDIETKDFAEDWGIDRRRWRLETNRALMKRIEQEAYKEARMASREMQEDGIIDAMDKARGQKSKGRAIERVFGNMNMAYFHIGNVNEKVNHAVWLAVDAQFDRVEAKVAKMQAEGKTKREIRQEIRRMIGARSQWRSNLRTNLTTTAVEGARHAVYEQAGRKVRKVWKCQQDERTRPTHVKADGQRRVPTTKFHVGKARLMYPGDPTTTELGEIMGCRCWIEWKPAVSPSKPPTKPAGSTTTTTVNKPSGGQPPARKKPVIRKSNANRKKRRR